LEIAKDGDWMITFRWITNLW